MRISNTEQKNAGRKDEPRDSAGFIQDYIAASLAADTSANITY